MARSSCSAGERLGTAIPYLRTESLKRTELKLFDRPFSFAEAPSDFANTAFLDETFADHPALNLRKLLKKPKEMNVALDEVQIRGGEIGLGRRMLELIGLSFTIGALEMVDDRV